MLEIKNLHAEVDGKKILNGINLSVPKGQVHAIMGPNGSGKSTLSYVMAGKPGYEATEGEILLDGENILAMQPDERPRLRGLALPRDVLERIYAANFRRRVGATPRQLTANAEHESTRIFTNAPE